MGELSRVEIVTSTNRQYPAQSTWQAAHMQAVTRRGNGARGRKEGFCELAMRELRKEIKKTP